MMGQILHHSIQLYPHPQDTDTVKNKSGALRQNGEQGAALTVQQSPYHWPADLGKNTNTTP